jgi:stage V sporulation protein G
MTRTHKAVRAVVRLHRDSSRGRTLLAFADLQVGGFEIRGLRVLEGKEGPYVSFPMRKSAGGGFFEVARPMTEAAREQAKAAVLSAYKRAAARSK